MHSLYGVYILWQSASQTQRIDPLWGLSLAQRRRKCSQNSIMMGAWGLSSCSCQEKMTTDIYYKYTYICSILYTLYGTLDFVNYFYRAYVPCGIWRNFFLACLAALSQLWIPIPNTEDTDRIYCLEYTNRIYMPHSSYRILALALS